MITPARTLTLVHAVQQPLGEPNFVQLPVVHNPAAPIFASALRNLFTPITAWRAHESHAAALLGGMQIHAASSSKLDLNARWLEVTDDPTQPGPAEQVQSQTLRRSIFRRSISPRAIRHGSFPTRSRRASSRSTSRR